MDNVTGIIRKGVESTVSFTTAAARIIWKALIAVFTILVAIASFTRRTCLESYAFAGFLTGLSISAIACMFIPIDYPVIIATGLVFGSAGLIEDISCSRRKRS